MKATQTFVVDLNRLEAQGLDANLVIRLMRAADDLAIANWGLRHFSEEQRRLQRHVQEGARRYFVRLQCGHLTEALELVGELHRNPRLCSLLSNCQPFAQEAFRRLVDLLPSGRGRRRFDKQVRSIRNRAAFHYDPSLVSKALRIRARRPQSCRSTITRGTEITLWRSGLADDIEDTIVCRLLWKIPRSRDLRAETDKILHFGESCCRDFLDLSGELTFRYLRETATV